MICKAVNIYPTTGFFGGIAEYGKLGSHEKLLPVKTHSVVVRSYLCPLLTIKAVVEVCSILSATLSWTEVCVNAKPYLGVFLIQIHALNDLFTDVFFLYGLIFGSQFDCPLFKLQYQLAPLLPDGQGTGSVVKGSKTGTIAVFLLRDLHFYLTA